MCVRVCLSVYLCVREKERVCVRERESMCDGVCKREMEVEEAKRVAALLCAARNGDDMLVFV